MTTTFPARAAPEDRSRSVSRSTAGRPPTTSRPSWRSARRVAGPHTPSGRRPYSPWSPLSADSVNGPNRPSARPGSKPSSIRRSCRAATSSPMEQAALPATGCGRRAGGGPPAAPPTSPGPTTPSATRPRSSWKPRTALSVGVVEHVRARLLLEPVERHEGSAHLGDGGTGVASAEDLRGPAAAHETGGSLTGEGSRNAPARRVLAPAHPLTQLTTRRGPGACAAARPGCTGREPPLSSTATSRGRSRGTPRARAGSRPSAWRRRSA